MKIFGIKLRIENIYQIFSQSFRLVASKKHVKSVFPFAYRYNIRQICMVCIMLLLLPLSIVNASEPGSAPGFFVYESNTYITEAEAHVQPTAPISSDLRVEGAIPFVSVPASAMLETEINNRIRSVHAEKLEYAQSNAARSISFAYDYKSYLSYGSILIYVTTALSQTKEEVISINFDTQRGALTDIQEFLGINAVPLINSVVTGEMRKAPDNYNVGFSGVKQNINFYVEAGCVYVLFDKYEVAPGSRGIVSICVNMGSVVNIVLPKSHYIVKTSQYDLKMLPLLAVCQMIGYSVNFNDFTQVIELANGNVTVKCAVGENRYYRLGDPPKSLEAPPEIHDNAVYVPISFLDSMLNVVYSIDSEENIILSFMNDYSF